MLHIDKIVQLQKDLDNAIHSKHNVTSLSTFTHRKLALIVEIGELANEVRSFKYWSLKKPSAQEIILEEFVDCLHFTISLGNSMNIDFDSIEINTEHNNDLNNLFIDTIELVTKLDFDDENSYKLMFNSIFALAMKLGFTSEQIFNAYILKNEENHIRQQNNY